MLKSLKLTQTTRRSFTSLYQNIIHTSEGKTAVIQLNRPKALNALNNALMEELNHALRQSDEDEAVHSIIITGSERAFAAGADIKEMLPREFSSVYSSRMLQGWKGVSGLRKPVIAGVSGFALGGGFELALMCDIILATKSAKFGLPEVTIGTIPGAGGTQRLIREIGKSRAMEMILTGEPISADEALKLGLVSRVVEGDLLEECKKVAEKINRFSSLTVSMAKDCVNQAYNLSLRDGLDYEQRVFWSTFATEDRKEGMSAFAEKRPAAFKNK